MPGWGRGVGAQAGVAAPPQVEPLRARGVAWGRGRVAQLPAAHRRLGQERSQPALGLRVEAVQEQRSAHHQVVAPSCLGVQQALEEVGGERHDRHHRQQPSHPLDDHQEAVEAGGYQARCSASRLQFQDWRLLP